MSEGPGVSEKSVHVGWKRALLYSLLPLFALLVVLEAGARIAEIWLPPWAVDYGWGVTGDRRLFVPSPEDASAMVTNPAKEAFFPKARFTMPKGKNEFRIFMLGGSSVNYISSHLESLALDLTHTRGDGRQFQIIACGGLAYGTHRLAPILSEVLGYDPDMILIYSGHNEFEEAYQLQLAQLRRLPLQRVLFKSAFCRFVRDRLASWQVSQLQRNKNRIILSGSEADPRTGAFHKFTPEEIERRMRAYHNNLHIMISMCRAAGVPVVIGTVSSNLWKPDLAFSPFQAEVEQIQTHYAKGEYEQGVALAREILRKSPRHQASDTENGIIRKLASDERVPLADVEAAVIKAEPHGVPGETLLDDRCHLNERGNEILIRVFREKVEELLK